MSRIQVPLLGSMLVIAVAAVGFAAIRSGSNAWVGLFSLVVVVVLLMAVVLANYGERRRRPFWFGFALFGWSAYLLATGSPNGMFRNFRNEEDSPANFLMMRIIQAIASHVRKDADAMGGIDAHSDNAARVAYLMVTLVFAAIGGLVVILIRDRRSRGRDGTPRPRGRSAGLLALIVFLLGGITFPAIARSLRTRLVYFPPPAEAPEGLRDDGRQAWLSGQLHTMDEPSLWASSRRDADAEVYRFLEFPSFLHPVGIRIAKAGDGAILRIVILDSKGGYAPGRIGLDRTVRVSPSQWRELVGRIALAKFWEPPTPPAYPVEFGAGTDGTSYYIEGVRGGRYGMVELNDVDSRDDVTPYSTLRDFVRELTAVDLRESSIDLD